MQILLYAGLELGKLRSKFNKACAAIERDDFRSVDMKKLAPTVYYRAKLDDASRLLVRFVRHGGQTACLVLEVIANHAYDKSRFLRGARVDEALITDATVDEAQASAEAVRYLHPGRGEFHMLEQPISFDDAQETIYHQPPPLILVGSAGSGKTALTLAKLRQASGQVL